MPRYPAGYGTTMVSLARLREIHEPRMHPEFSRRLFPWIEAQNGLIGIGGGWRATGTQPDKPGFAPEGRSFHQDQRFASGFVGYAAVDLVARNDAGPLRRLLGLNGSPANPDATTLTRLRTVDKVHRAPTWAESASAPEFGLHTFITNEPWHMQCIEMRGWSTWVNAGRPDPVSFVLPTDPESEEDKMAKWIQPDDGDPCVLSTDGMLATWVNNGDAAADLAEAGVRIDTRVGKVPRTALRGLTLIGSPPAYPPGYTGPRTTPAHFAGHLT